MKKNNFKDDEIAYSVDIAAKKLHLHPNTLYQMVRENKIPHKKIGKRIIFPKERLIKWLNEVNEREDD